MGKERDPVCVQVGRNIRRLRSASGWSQKQLAERLGVAFQQVQKYESGQNQIGSVKLHRLTLIFQCDAAAFFIGLGVAPAADPLNAGDEYATMRTSRVVQSISDRRVRKCFIDLGRELGKMGRDDGDTARRT